MLAKAWRPAIFTLSASGSGLIVSSLLKYTVDRPRPDLVPHGNLIYTTSFPSGHSMMSAVIYLTLAVLIARLIERQRLKAYALGVAIVPDPAGRRLARLPWRALAIGRTGGMGRRRCLGLGCWLIARWIGLGGDTARAE